MGEENLIKLLAVEPLMKLGYEIDYYDIEKGLPEEETMDLYYGIITWYKGPSMYNASGYCEWLADQVASARKVVVMGNSVPMKRNWKQREKRFPDFWEIWTL